MYKEVYKTGTKNILEAESVIKKSIDEAQAWNCKILRTKALSARKGVAS